METRSKGIIKVMEQDLTEIRKHLNTDIEKACTIYLEVVNSV